MSKINLTVTETPPIQLKISPGPGPTGPTGAAGADGVGVPTGGTSGQVLAKASSTNYDTHWVDQTGGGGSGTVSTVSVVTANGFAGSVVNPTTTPAITLTTSVTGVLKGNGTAISAATSGTDYSAGTSALATGILKSTTATGNLSIAVAGDFPTLNQNTTGTAATFTGNLAGDVTSVAMTTTVASVGGSTAAAVNTAAVLVNTAQSGNKFLASPSNGSSAAPAFRVIVGVDLPNPSSSTLGGVQSVAAVTSNWIRSISTSGVPALSRPAFTDISGTVAAAQLPNPSASSLGGVQSAAAVSQQWINSISTSGVPALSQPAFSDISGSVAASQMPAFTGDITTSAGAVATTIAANVVTNAKLATMATASFKGRTTAGTGNVEDLSATQATALLNAVVGDSGSGGTKGLVPAPASGDAAALKFLKADGTWAAPSGTVSTVSVVTANGFAGSVANATSTPAITITTSITGVLKGNGTAISAATSGTDYSAGTSALATGILKSTTSTGDLSIAVAGDFPTLNQNTTGTAATFTGNLTGDVTSVAMTTTVASVGGSTAANVHAAELLANAATDANTASAIVKRDSSGNFSAGTVTASLTGHASLDLPLAGGTMSGAIAMGTNKITGVGDPSAAQDVATKAYVDATAANGVSKVASVYATIAALPTNTYNNGSSGVGATLTGVAFGALVVDGNTVTVGQRILVKNEVTAANNGIYVVTTVGAVATLYVLTRATDFNSSVDIVDGATNFVTSGATLNATTWELNLAGAPTVGSTSLNFIQIAGVGTYLAGVGLNLSGSTFSLANPSASSLGGVQSYAAVSNQWIRAISTSGVPSSSQPAFTDISGTVAAAQLPNPTTSSLGGIQAITAVTSNWIRSISTSGVPALSQPAFTDISGSVAASQMPALTGDVTTSAGAVATTVVTVGGSTAANVHAAELLANAATSANTASAIVKRDSNKNAILNSVTQALTSTATAAGTTTLTVASTRNQVFTGATTQQVNLPDETTLPATGFQFLIANSSSGVVTVKDAGGSTIQAMAANSHAWFTATSIASASAGWDTLYVAASSIAIAAFGSTPNSAGGSVSGSTLTLQPADGTNPGGVSTGSQTIGGSKTLGNSAADKLTIGAASSTAVHQSKGGWNRTTRTLTAATLTVDTTTADEVIYTDSTSNAITITLPAPTNGRVLIILDKTGQANANNITINPNASETINGLSTIKITTAYNGYIFYSDGTNWTAISSGYNPQLAFAFGGGLGGNLSISSGTTTLTTDAYYNNVTITSTGKLATAGYKLFVAGILDLTGAGAAAIQNNGVDATAGATAGTAGSAGTAVTAKTLGAGANGAAGGAGGTAGGSNGSAGTVASSSNGGSVPGAGGGGAGSGGSGGSAGTSATGTNANPIQRFAMDLQRGVTLITGGSGGGGGGGGGGDGTSGGGGGGGGSGAGVIFISANFVKTSGAAASSIQAIGGLGGGGGAATAGTRGGGAGGSGGGGGWVFLQYGTKIDAAATNLLDVSGGTGAAGGNGTNSGASGGNGGGGGAGGRITLVNLTTGLATESFGGSTVTRNTTANSTGAAAQPGQTTQVSF